MWFFKRNKRQSEAVNLPHRDLGAAIEIEATKETFKEVAGKAKAANRRALDRLEENHLLLRFMQRPAAAILIIGMIDLTILAATLLTLRLISVGFLTHVLLRQWRLIRQGHRELSTTRRILFAIVLITFAGNAIPILIDVAALTGDYVRRQPPTLGLAYAFSNAITSAVSAAGWWFLYKMIEKESGTLHREHEADK